MPSPSRVGHRGQILLLVSAAAVLLTSMVGPVQQVVAEEPSSSPQEPPGAVAPPLVEGPLPLELGELVAIQVALFDDGLRGPALGPLPSPAELVPAPPAGEAAAPPLAAEPPMVEAPPPEEELWPIPPIDWTTWTDRKAWIEFITPNRFETGGLLNGGTRDSWTLTMRSRWSHENKLIKQQIEFRGRYTQVESRLSANEWINTNDIDLKSSETGWLVFNKMLFEYDEIEQLSLRATDSLGVGYRFFDDAPNKYLVIRVGPTITYEQYYNPDDVEWKPEFLTELDVKWKIRTVRFEHKTSVFPSLRDDQGVRMINDTGLLIPLDTEDHWSCKLGFLHNYNGTPVRNVQRNDYTASFSIVFQQ